MRTKAVASAFRAWGFVHEVVKLHMQLVPCRSEIFGIAAVTRGEAPGRFSHSCRCKSTLRSALSRDLIETGILCCIVICDSS